MLNEFRPSLKYIAKKTKEIRKTWSKKEKLKRLRVDLRPQQVTIQEYSLAELPDDYQTVILNNNKEIHNGQ